MISLRSSKFTKGLKAYGQSRSAQYRAFLDAPWKHNNRSQRFSKKQRSFTEPDRCELTGIESTSQISNIKRQARLNVWNANEIGESINFETGKSCRTIIVKIRAKIPVRFTKSSLKPGIAAAFYTYMLT